MDVPNRRIVFLVGLACGCIGASCQRQPQEIPTQQPVAAKVIDSGTSGIDPDSYVNPFGDAEIPALDNPAASSLEDKGATVSPSPSLSPLSSTSASSSGGSSGSNIAMLQTALSSLPALMQCMSQQCDPNAVFGMLSGTFLNTMAASGENGAMIAQSVAPLMGMFGGGGGQ